MTADLATRDIFVPEERAIGMIEACAAQLARVATIEDVKRVISQADAIAAVVRKIKASDAVRRSALRLQLDAEIQLGTLTRDIPRGATGRSAARNPGQPTKTKVLKAHGLPSQRVNLAERMAAMPREKVMAAASASRSGTLAGVATDLGLKSAYVHTSTTMRKIAMNAIGLLVQCQTVGRAPKPEEVDPLREAFGNADAGREPAR